MIQDDDPTDVETAIAALYRGPLDQFVTRRDTLTKHLRATKDRDAAARVKALRKPSRMAWVLNNIAHDDSAAIDQLAAAIGAAQAADDVRAAFERVKEAVRNVAAVGARAAFRAEQPIEPNEIVAAVHAVIGHADAFAEFRSGRLVDVPEAGGLDMLAAVSLREQPHKIKSPSSAPLVVTTAKTEVPADSAKRILEIAKAARADLHRGEATLAAASKRSEHAAHSVLDSQKMLDAAERALLHAQGEAQSRRADLERARTDADAAAADLQDAERVVAAARTRLATIEEP